MYSRLQLQFDDDVMTLMIYGSFCLSLFSHSSRDLRPKTFYFQFPLLFKTLSAFVTWFKCVQISLGFQCVMIWSTISPTALLLNLREWWVKEKGWRKESLAIYWPVWEQRLMCELLVSSKDPVSHSVQARADKNPFVDTHSKCPFAALNWQLWPHK